MAETKSKQNTGPGLFDIVDEITTGSRNLVSLSGAKYPGFMVNRALSQHPDTFVQSQMMNFFHELPGDMQMQYLLESVQPKKKRRGKWAKKEKHQRQSDLENIQSWYQVNQRRAMQILERLSEEELQVIDRKFNLDRGGKAK